MNYLSLAEASRSKKIPTSSGKPISIPTLWRWCVHGCKGVKLEHVRFGRRVAISEEALDRFAVELARVWSEPEPEKPTKPTTQHKPKPRTAAQRAKAIAAAEARLRARGCMSSTESDGHE